MEKKELYDTFTELESQTEATLKIVKTIKEELSQLTEENNVLRMENQHLRDRLAEITKQQSIEKQMTDTGLTKSRLNLEKIYEDGFHVCNLFYGSRRDGDEPCAFCLDVIYGERR
ncbi:MAG: DNA replication initiation control protein YabA [Alkalibacterium gilvum]|uniref:Replication initiation control protein YabA n=1 Tax=Alkalibacterium gilvum TaxID=1130080 RepID=A0A1H6TBM1_9LACT|nr:MULTISPECIES: DNA replication initiation control protein YabA [Alkalibacterium]MDN6194796.1 DNA replication initiation control protein YabA [Alkalibacterium sp.]MDN6293999.1 DNA replication initiation control protein YabA [Alkalibacterium sp.]MDN6295622.1 DNA replication initiation control protein YabA [Alkalibacterium sp.]MDN6398542.1 DNA replication initiation control protein YabA [Alkalibacterium sp.]MDN6728912.1 DNA replication initiation control protein YabA [Alkalibacterium sp.]